MERIDGSHVRLKEGLFRERQELNTKYLLSLDSTALLQNYTLEAGDIIKGCQVISDPESTVLHWGWEAPTCQLRGHFLGHWMSAAALTVYSEKNRVLKAKLFDIVDKLREYQLKNGGKWVGPIPEKYFRIMTTGRYIWSPQYTMHKLFMGLLDTYEYTSYAPAMTILSHLSDWYTEWLESIESVDPRAQYGGESCGMTEIWARLWRLTGEEKYSRLLKKYDSPDILNGLANGKDTLSGNHANAAIPWAHGAARIYEISRNEKWLKLVKAFWECAVKDRSYYATSGANSGEFFVPPGKLAEQMGERTQEFCTVYNMVRLADYLYRFTGEKSYCDYIERALYNGFLAQQDPRTGMPAYFLPLAAGSRKKWGTPTKDFWCCHGTMIQAHTLVSSLIYYKDESKVIINQYIPSRAEFKVSGTPVVIELSSAMKYAAADTFFSESDVAEDSRWAFNISIKTGKPQRFMLMLRIPSWLKGMPVVTVDGERRFITSDVIADGYLKIDREWSESRVGISFTAEPYTEPLAGSDNLAALMEGPVVLAAPGEGVRFRKGFLTELKRRCEHSYETYPWLQSHYSLESGDTIKEFRPLYEMTDEAYTVYNVTDSAE
ncbi:MAG: glycoside hydrolase family 127 protein [Lachnospiraceae bacterium]|nr:glycoside hydrolase family 127 protein [Lachnospiraceae bacterium]